MFEYVLNMSLLTPTICSEKVCEFASLQKIILSLHTEVKIEVKFICESENEASEHVEFLEKL